MAESDASLLNFFAKAGRIGWRGASSVVDASSVVFARAGRIGYRGTAAGLFNSTALAYSIARAGYRGTCSFMAASPAYGYGRVGCRGLAYAVAVTVIIPEGSTVPPRI